MDMSSQMLTFVKVVEMGSISAASRASGQTPSALSKQIGHLEDHVGLRLLRRTRSGVSLTPEGSAFYEKCRAMAETFYEAEAYISTFDAAPRGTLRIACSVAFGKFQLINALPVFLTLYPELKVSLELTDRTVSLEEDSFDAAITFAEQLTHPDVMVRKIMRNERVLCAAPSFLEKHGHPQSFGDLENFNCLRTSTNVARNAWHAELDGVQYDVDATGNFEGNSADAVFKAALAGLGIARLSTYIVADTLASGDLVQLFPGYAQPRADIAVTYAERRNLSPNIRALVDFLAQRFA